MGRAQSTTTGRIRGALHATNVQNEVADALSDEAKITIASAMNGLPEDVLAYVMAYTPVIYWSTLCVRVAAGFLIHWCSLGTCVAVLFLANACRCQTPWSMAHAVQICGLGLVVIVVAIVGMFCVLLRYLVVTASPDLSGLSEQKDLFAISASPHAPRYQR